MKGRLRGATHRSAPVLEHMRLDEGPICTVRLPIRTGGGLNERMHRFAQARRTKSERKVARLLAPAASLPCIVTLTRLSPGMLDDDNLRGSLKGVRDGVADKLGVDDRDPRVTWLYRQERAAGFAVLVRIEPRGEE